MYRVYDNKNKKWVDSFFINPNGEVFNFSVDGIHSYQMGACVINNSDKIDATVCRKTKYRCDGGDIYTGHIIKLTHQTGHEEYDEEIIEVVDESSIDVYFEDNYQEECEIVGWAFIKEE